MLTAFALALCTVAAFFITACRLIPLRRLLGVGTALDVTFTLAVTFLFFGTLTGLLVAMFSGLIMAITVTLGRACIGYDRPHVYRYGLRLLIVWTPHPRRVKWPVKKARQQPTPANP